MSLIKLNISSAGTHAAVMVGGITYYILSETGNVGATLVSTGTTGAAYIASAGARYIAGNSAGMATFTLVNELGKTVIKPAIIVGSKKTAIVSSVILGGIAGLATTAVVAGVQYTGKKTSELIQQYNTPSVSDIHNSYCITEYKEATDEFDDFDIIEFKKDDVF